MNIQLIADSCCDVTPAMRNMMGLLTAPLKITIDGTKHFVDDTTLNIRQLLATMKASKNPVATAAPAPEAYAELMREADASIVVTLSANLSGSYNAAVAARDIVHEDQPDKPILVLDSKSASAGMTRLVLKAHELIKQGLHFDEICESLNDFTARMRTFFVLEDLSNLVKNGRIPKLSGMIGSMLMLRPIMGENGNGEIIPVEKVRGTKQALAKLVSIVADRTGDLPDSSVLLTLSHCNAPERATEVKQLLLAQCPALSEVLISPTGGISTCYANDGGVVVAFETSSEYMAK